MTRTLIQAVCPRSRNTFGAHASHSAASCERAREDRHRGQRDPAQSRRDPKEAAQLSVEDKLEGGEEDAEDEART